MDAKDYVGREQAYVKHFVLQRYLQALALKLGQHTNGTTINYIDGFSGPWDDGLPLVTDRVTSPNVALEQLRNARDQLRNRGITLTVRALFVDSDPAAYARLTALLSRWTTIETVSYCGKFEDHVPDVVHFAESGSRPFAFVFIDPTGWTGFGLRQIERLLQVRRSEVLVNFMLKDILRFVDDQRVEQQHSFEELFGQCADTLRTRWRGLSGIDREDAIVRAYCDRVRTVGNFSHCTSTIVLHPGNDRTHYHLVYATRSLQGLLTFREIERDAMKAQSEVRAHTKRANRLVKTKQPEMFAPIVLDTPFIDELEERYRTRAEAETRLRLAPIGAEIPYDDLVGVALSWPTVNERILKEWLKSWQSTGEIELLGLSRGERVPKPERGHRVRRLH
jgi:three-Cys-motif partner protein